jgi:hypothetical protein
MELTKMVCGVLHRKGSSSARGAYRRRRCQQVGLVVSPQVLANSGVFVAALIAS